MRKSELPVTMLSLPPVRVDGGGGENSAGGD